MTYAQMPPRPTAVRPKRWPYFLVAGVGVFFLLAFSLIVAVAPKKPPATNDVKLAAPAPTSTVQASTAPSTPSSSSPPKTSAQPGPATSAGPGTYKVGEDLAAGSYKATCEGHGYWSRMRSDNTHDTIANDFNASGGPMRFTTKVGEYVKISGGCTFVKVAN
ncbi:hypothetical protein [Amycolatopsis japonica]